MTWLMDKEHSLNTVVHEWSRSRLPRVHSWEQILGELRYPIEAIDLSLDFIRHGETTLNMLDRVTGTQDVGLTARGIAQARAAALRLRSHYDIAWSSSLRRSRETLEIVLRGAKLRAEVVFVDPRLNERALGELEGKPSVRIDAYARGDFRFAPSGGESYLMVTRRVLSFLIDVAQLARNVRRPVCALICTHVGPMRIFAGVLENQSDPARVLNASFSNVEVIGFHIDKLVLPEFIARVL